MVASVTAHRELLLLPTLKNSLSQASLKAITTCEALFSNDMRGSTFSTCPHQQLPRIDGLPVEIHLNDKAQPLASHRAILVLADWQEKVYADLDQDEALGVIERVPFGERADQCFCMVIPRKHDGSPCRTVDLLPVNNYYKRENHNVETLFHIVHRIPFNARTTITDAWNSDHSLSLCVSDHQLAMSITLVGTFQFKRAPQGFLSSRNGCNHRFDAILADFLQ